MACCLLSFCAGVYSWNGVSAGLGEPIMTKIILLNGPPRSGMSTAAALLLEAFPQAREYKFTTPMDRAFPAFFGLSAERWKELREKEKDLEAVELFGWRPRSVLISFSEDWAKQLFGPAVFGQLAATGFLPEAPLIICSDSGFPSEAAALLEKFGASNMLQICLFRRGTSFEGDSRSYWEIEELLRIDIQNNGSLEDLKGALVQRIQDWVFMSGTEWTEEEVCQIKANGQLS